MSGAAKYRNKLEPPGTCTAQEGKSLLQKLCPLLEVLALKVKHPGLLQKSAIDSLGIYLNEINPEQCRHNLVTASSQLKVHLRCRAYETMFVDASETLSYVKRMQCIPIRGTNEVARRLTPTERGQAELVIEFGEGAVMSVRQQTNQCNMLVLFTSLLKKKKVLSAILEDCDGAALEKLFEGAGRGARALIPPEPLNATLVNYKDSAFWTLPLWYTELMAQVAQDVFRLHVLASASSADISRALFVDRVTAHRIDGPNVEYDNVMTVIKAILHKASGGCICHLHHKKSTTPFRRMEMRFEICGAALVNGKCPRHCAEDTVCTESSTFPGVCAKAFRVELWCTHELVQGKPPCGVRVSLTNMFADKDQPLVALRAPLLDLACCGARLTKSATNAELVDLEADALQTFAEIYRLRFEEGRSGEDMRHRDAAAVWLLRKGGVSIGTDGKFKGAKVQAELQTLAQTHGHLFRKTFIK